MFNNETHKETFLSLCPGKLLDNMEWAASVFILTSDEELRRKTSRFIDPAQREINWDGIMKNDFGSGHRAALYWAFSLWAGNSWPTDDGHTDTMDKAFYMDEGLRRTAVIALMLRWRLKSIEI